MKWFKFYGQDYLCDPKILALTASERSCWLTLLAYGSINDNGVITFLSEEQLMAQAGITPNSQEWEKTKGVVEKLKKLEMIKSDNAVITLKNWQKRQETNLTGYERVKRFREKRRDNARDNALDNAEITSDKNRIDKIRKDNKDTKVSSAVALKPKKEKRSDIDQLLEGIKKIVKVVDGSILEQRRFAKNFIDSKTPEILRQSGNLNPTAEQIQNATFRIFQIARQDKFHSKNCTSLKYVYNKAGAIVMSAKSTQPMIANIPNC